MSNRVQLGAMTVSDCFDEEALLESIDGDMEFLRETIGMLDEDAPALLAEVQQAASAKDAPGLVKPAHALKSMLGNFCAAAAQEAARTVEVMGRENRLDDVDMAVKALHQEADRLKTALRAFLEARGE